MRSGIGASTSHHESATLPGYRAVPTLDAVIYQDGSYEGEDTGDLAHHFATNRVAEYDAGHSILQAIHELLESNDQLTAASQFR